MRTLPVIYNQGSTPRCQSYAIAGAANFQLAAKGNTDRVDPDKLYELETGSGGNTLSAVLAKCELTGLPLLSGKTVKLKSYTRIIPGSLNAISALKAGLPLVLSFQIGYTDGMALDANYVLISPLESHSMVLCDYDAVNHLFFVANSWGQQWGAKGYFYIDGQWMSQPYETDLYSLILDI